MLSCLPGISVDENELIPELSQTTHGDNRSVGLLFSTSLMESPPTGLLTIRCRGKPGAAAPHITIYRLYGAEINFLQPKFPRRVN